MRQGPDSTFKAGPEVPGAAGQESLEPKKSRGEGLTPYERAEEFSGNLSEEVREIGLREDTLHKRYWPELPESHETYIAVKDILRFLLEQAGFPRDFLGLSIFDSEYPEVSVQFTARKVRVSRTTLEVLKGNAEKLAVILAHEVSHVLLAHYAVLDASPDPLNEHIQRYEHEYQADKSAVLMTNRLGIDPNTLAHTLNDLEHSLRGLTEITGEDEDSAHKDFSRSAWIFSTHPHTTRRMSAAKREALALPAYKRSLELGTIPIPQKSAFPHKVDFRKWDMPSLGDALMLDIYPDCLWDEIKIPVSIQGRIEKYDSKKNEQRRMWISGSPRLILEQTGLGAPRAPLPTAVPEDINAWTEEDSSSIETWWLQSMRTLDGLSGYDDLSDDIRSFSLEATKLLLRHVAPEYVAANNRSISSEKQSEAAEDETRGLAKDTILYEPKFYQPAVEMTIAVSLLVRNWFEKDLSAKGIQGMEEVLAFLRRFKDEHGAYLPYSGARFMVVLEGLYGSASEEERKKIVELCEEYHRELVAGTDKGLSLAEGLMPNILARIGQEAPDRFFVPSTVRAADLMAEPDFIKEVKRVCQKTPIPRDEARKALADVPRNFRPRNLTLLVHSIGMQLFDEENEEGVSDIVLEADPVASSVLLSMDEFEEKYFGQGRSKYVKARYGAFESRVTQYENIAILWKKAGYGRAFSALPAGPEKLEFLLDTFPARSAQRDTLIFKALGWKKLVYVEDVLKAQKQLLDTRDIPLLLRLSGVFSNPLLDLSAYQKLWELYEQDPEAFFADIPLSERERVRAEMREVLGESENRRLEAILLSHREPSYVRDELLRPLVDAAPDQASTMALASWYCEPPPSMLRSRSGEMVAVTESLLDILREMPKLDKQELFLYFLGQRFFYSAIDAKFFHNIRKSEKQYRSDALLLGEAAFRRRYDMEEDPDIHKPDNVEDEAAVSAAEKRMDWLDAGEDDSEDSEEWSTSHDLDQEPVAMPGAPDALSPAYLVKSPDSLVFLTKASGVPIELLLKQQRLATTRREQREFITNLLLGTEGILLQDNKSEFLSAVARNVVENSAWSAEQSAEERTAMIDLLGFALAKCPERRIPDLFLGLWNLQQDKGTLPEVVATLFRELGPLFIKAGQYLGTQSGALPIEWVRAFRTLSDQNKRAEKSMVYEYEHALYGDASPFVRIGEKLGEGSMAAVYRGEVRSSDDRSRDVALKIFHPNTLQELDEDTGFLDELVKFVNTKRSEFRVSLPDNLGDVSKAQILKELSYESVIKNNKDMAKVLARSTARIAWRVPAILEETSNPQLIVSEYSDGVALDALQPDLASEAKGEIALELLRQVLAEGVYQGDPNVGNFKAFVEGGSVRLVDWLDTDHTGRLDEQETKSLRDLIVEVMIGKDEKKTAGLLTGLIQEDGREEPLPVGEVEGWLRDEQILNESSLEDIERIFTSFLDFLADRKLVLKEQYVTLLRALGLMKPLLTEVKPEQLALLTASLYGGE